ncbi:MAG: glycine cleavage system protein GcvH [Thermoprotei archaeon]|jgi:glycine cleavage system H protein
MSQNIEAPENYRYSKTHEWVKVEDNTATVGITFYAQKKLRDVIYVELPEKGKIVKAGETIGTIESVKATEEIYTPVSGTIIDINIELTTSPELINKDPYGKGWIVKIKISDTNEISKLMTANEYKTYTASTK